MVTSAVVHVERPDETGELGPMGPMGPMGQMSDPGLTAPHLPSLTDPSLASASSGSAARRSARQSGRGTQRSPRVPLATRRALRAELHGVGLTITHAARLLGVRLGTLDALLSGRQHVSSRLGYHHWPERVHALCDQMRQSNTILARHLDAAAHEIAAAGLPLPAFVGGAGPRSRAGRRTAGLSAGVAAGLMVGSAPRTATTGITTPRKRAS